MTDYTIQYNRAGLSILKDDDDPIWIFVPDGLDGVRFVDNGEMSSTTKTQPTDRFWESLVDLYRFSRSLGHTYDAARSKTTVAIMKAGVLHIDWEDNEYLPEYENRLISMIREAILFDILNGEMIGDYPYSRRLFRTAFKESEDEVPYSELEEIPDEL